MEITVSGAADLKSGGILCNLWKDLPDAIIFCHCCMKGCCDHVESVYSEATCIGLYLA